MTRLATDQSETQAQLLIEAAIESEKSGDTRKALDAYRSALDFLVPLLRYEPSHRKRLDIKKKVEDLVQKAESLKDPYRASSVQGTSRYDHHVVQAYQARKYVIIHTQTPKPSGLFDPFYLTKTALNIVSYISGFWMLVIYIVHNVHLLKL